MIIAIDGPAASGKGTLSRRIARHYGFIHLDTGALYRAVAARVLWDGGDPNDTETATRAAASIDPDLLADPRLKSDDIGQAASIVAAMPEVRAALLDYQRSLAATPPGAVLDGRDIGTVVCPDANVKFYVTAEIPVRAERRYLELKARGEAVDRSDVLDDLEARDARDSGRADAPLALAQDAHLLDTTNLDIEAAFEAAIAIIDGS
ncbi:MAG: (d)CMP kinase [Geminicoccaceae bacterium]